MVQKQISILLVCVLVLLVSSITAGNGSDALVSGLKTGCGVSVPDGEIWLAATSFTDSPAWSKAKYNNVNGAAISGIGSGIKMLACRVSNADVNDICPATTNKVSSELGSEAV